MCNLADTVAAHGRMVWIRLRDDRRKPSCRLGESTPATSSGRSRPSAEQVDADQHVVLTQPQLPQQLDPRRNVSTSACR